MSTYIREDLTRNEKIQQARRIVNENPGAIDAWAILIQDAQEKKISESRDFYELLIGQFPTCGKFWKLYIESEIKGRNYQNVEKLFERCLTKVLNIDLWKCYISYVRDTKGILPSFREKMVQAYDFALDKIGMDIYAYTIWNDYVVFLRSLEAVGPYAENQKIIAVRKVYQKGIMTPMISVELLWKDYCSFEMNVNPTLGKTMIESRSRDFSNAKRLTKEFESLTRPIDRNNPCLPPNVPLTSEEIKQLSAWRKFITWERSNPLKTEDKLLLTRRIQLAYEQSLLCFGYHVDLWFEICSYLEQTSRFYAEHGDIHMSKRFLDDTAHFYERAIQTFMRSNMLIHFAYADFEEARLNIDKARAIYNHLLDRKEAVHLTDPTLAYIQAMQFERRVDGIKSARAVFKRAREDSRINYQVYVAAALMEYYCTKDQKIACNIFNLGLKKYPQHVDYILAYVDYMTHLNEDQNARVLFDGLLAQEQGISNESQAPIWTEFLKFESQLGDLASIKNVEQRRANLFAKFNQLDGRQTALLVDRYRFLDLCPCSTDDLKLLGLQTQSDPIIESSSSSIIKDRRDSLPKPDIKHMMPYRPTRNPLPGSHPTPGGVFPLPDTALYLVKVLPPTRNFEGPFVIVDQLMELLNQLTIPSTFEPIRMSIQGELIRDLDMNNSQQNRKTEHPDSDDEDQTETGVVNGRSAMNIYQQRQQKRAKLTTNFDS